MIREIGIKNLPDLHDFLIQNHGSFGTPMPNKVPFDFRLADYRLGSIIGCSLVKKVDNYLVVNFIVYHPEYIPWPLIRWLGEHSDKFYLYCGNQLDLMRDLHGIGLSYDSLTMAMVN